MRLRGTALRHLLLVVLVVAGARGATATPAIQEVGFGVADLTPDRPVPLAGWEERTAPFEGVHDRVKARAMVVRRSEENTDPEASVAIVSLDLAFVPGDLRAEVVRRTADMDLDEVVLAATGTRSGPGGLSRVPAWRRSSGPFDEALWTETAARIERAIRAAHADLAPANEALGTEAGGALAVLRVDGPGGRPKGWVVHHAAGPLLPASNAKVSADWPGALCDALEREGGGTALVLNGVLPDGSAEATGDFERVRALGEDLARRALAVSGRMDATGFTRLFTPSTVKVEAFTALGALLGHDDGRSLAPERAVELPVTRVGLGDFSIVTVPGEPTEAVGRAMDAGPGRWVVPRAQDHVGPLLDRETFRSGGPAADEAILGPEVGERLAATVTWPAPGARSAGEEAPVGVAVRVSGGTARELGLAHGDALRTRIRDLLAAVEGKVEAEVLGRGGGVLLAPTALASGLAPRDLVAVAMVRHARRLQRHVPADLLDEMEGIAEAAGVPYDAVLLENTFLTLAEQPDKTALLRMPARCTNLVATGEATSMGQLIHASTLDWGLGDVLKDRTVVLVVEPPTGHPFASVTWPGMVGTLRAMGAQGIAVTEESCAAEEDTTLDGLPVNLLLRRVVQHAEDLDDAVARVRAGPGTCGYKVTISDGRRLDARVVEVTARRSHVRRPDKGLLFGCDPEAPCDGGCDESIPRDDASSARRYPAARAVLETKRGTLRLGDLSAALSTTEGGVLNDGTLLACLFEPQLGRFAVALGKAVDPKEGRLDWTRYDLLALLSPERRARYAAPWRVEGPGEFVTRPGLSVGSLSVEEVEFRSPVCSGVQCNDAVRTQLFRPEEAKGVVLLMPPWKPGALAGEKLVAVTLAARGIATFILPLPYQASRAPEGVGSGSWTLSSNLARTREAMLQGAADAALVSRWLETQGFPPERQVVMGTSLGGHAAALAYGAYPDRFGAGVFLLTGSHVERAFLVPNGTTDRVARRLRERDVTEEEALDLVGTLDPGRYGHPDRKDRVLLLACREDPVVPPESVEALAAAWGGARIEWYPGDHYGLIAHLGEALGTIGEFLTERLEAP